MTDDELWERVRALTPEDAYGMLLLEMTRADLAGRPRMPGDPGTGSYGERMERALRGEVNILQRIRNKVGCWPSAAEVLLGFQSHGPVMAASVLAALHICEGE